MVGPVLQEGNGIVDAPTYRPVAVSRVASLQDVTEGFVVVSFVGWNPCPEGRETRLDRVVLSGVEGRGSDNVSRTQGSRHGSLVSNLRVGTRKGVPDLRDLSTRDG